MRWPRKVSRVWLGPDSTPLLTLLTSQIFFYFVAGVLEVRTQGSFAGVGITPGQGFHDRAVIRGAFRGGPCAEHAREAVGTHEDPDFAAQQTDESLIAARQGNFVVEVEVPPGAEYLRPVALLLLQHANQSLQTVSGVPR